MSTFHFSSFLLTTLGCTIFWYLCHDFLESALLSIQLHVQSTSHGKLSLIWQLISTHLTIMNSLYPLTSSFFNLISLSFNLIFKFQLLPHESTVAHAHEQKSRHFEEPRLQRAKSIVHPPSSKPDALESLVHTRPTTPTTITHSHDEDLRDEDDDSDKKSEKSDEEAKWWLQRISETSQCDFWEITKIGYDYIFFWLEVKNC